MMGHNKGLHMVAWILVMVGGLNWLLVGLFNWGIGDLFTGSMMWVAQVIYILVGLSAIYEIATHSMRCKDCETMGSKPMGNMGGMNS